MNHTSNNHCFDHKQGNPQSRQLKCLVIKCLEHPLIPYCSYSFDNTGLKITTHCFTDKYHENTYDYDEYLQKLESQLFQSPSQQCSHRQPHEAVGYCNQHKQFLCEEGTKAHREYFPNHKINYKAENPLKLQDLNICTKHNDAPKYMHCLKCWKNYCDKCKTEHDGHESVDWSTWINEGKFQEIKESIKCSEERYFNQWEKGFHRLQQEINVMYNNCLKINRQLFDVINKHFEAFEFYRDNYIEPLVMNICNLINNINIVYLSDTADIAENIRYYKENRVLDVGRIPRRVDNLPYKLFKLKDEIKGYNSINSMVKINENIIGIAEYCDVSIYSFTSKEVVGTLKGHTKAISRLLMIKDKTSLISCSKDKTLRIWNTKTWDCTQVLEKHTDSINDIIEVPADSSLISVSDDNSIIFWNSSAKKEYEFNKQITEAHQGGNVQCVVLLQNGQIVTGGWDRYWNLWERTSENKNDVVRKWKTPNNSVIYSMFQWKNSKLFVGTGDGNMFVYDITENTNPVQLQERHSKYVTCIIQWENDFIVSSGYDNRIKIFDSKKYKCYQTINKHSSCVNCVLKIKEGVFMSGSKDKINVFYQ